MGETLRTKTSFSLPLPPSNSCCTAPPTPYCFQRTAGGPNQTSEPEQDKELSSLATCTRAYPIKWITYCWWITHEYHIDPREKLMCIFCHTTGILPALSLECQDENKMLWWGQKWMLRLLIASAAKIPITRRRGAVFSFYYFPDTIQIA